MSKSVAIINNENFVENLIVMDDSFIDQENQITYNELNPAFIGGLYEDGFFYPPQPYPSWTKNEGKWLPPIPAPDFEASWDEDKQEWIGI